MITAAVLLIGCLSADLTGDGLVSRADRDAAPEHLRRYVASCIGAESAPVCGAYPLGYSGGLPVLVPGGWLVQPWSAAPQGVTLVVEHLTGAGQVVPLLEWGAEWIYDLPGVPPLSVQWTGQAAGVALGCAGTGQP